MVLLLVQHRTPSWNRRHTACAMLRDGQLCCWHACRREPSSCWRKCLWPYDYVTAAWHGTR